VMELLPDVTLRGRLKKGKLPPREAVRMLDQLLDALDYIHGQGMIHRDIKPGNIMLDGPERVVLMDFGLAREEGGPALSASGQIAGTPRCFAPELLLFQAATPSTDLWALGCVAYLMLTAKNPFSAETTQALLGQIMSISPPSIRDLNPAVPPALEALVYRFLEKEPKDRWASAAQAREALADIADALDVLSLGQGEDVSQALGEAPDNPGEDRTAVEPVPGPAPVDAAKATAVPGAGPVRAPRSGRVKRPSGAVATPGGSGSDASHASSSSTSTLIARLTASRRALALTSGALVACAVLVWRPALFHRPVPHPSPAPTRSVPSTPPTPSASPSSSAAVVAPDAQDAARRFIAATRLLPPRVLDHAWQAARDAARKASPQLDLTDIRTVVARQPAIATSYTKLVEGLMRGELARAWGALKPHVGALVAASADDALLDAVARADALDALAGHLGLPLPLGVQDALAPAVELRCGVDRPDEVLARSTALFPLGDQRAAFVFLASEVPTKLGSEFLNLTETHMYKRVEARERVPAGEVAFQVPGGSAGKLHLRIGVLSVQTYVKLSRPGRAGWLPVRLPDGSRVPWEREKWLTVTLRGALAAPGEWRASQARAWTPDPQRPYYALDRVLWEP
jgi:serine/threonine protein kinase